MTRPLCTILTAVHDKMFLTGTVDAVDMISPTLRLIAVAGPQLRDLPYSPGQQVRIHVHDLLSLSTWARPGDALRTYSIWSYDGSAGRLELVVYDHGGDGPGAEWARTVGVGDHVTFGKPEGDLVAREDAAFHLFAAEETGAVASAAIIRALPTTVTVYGVFESRSATEQLPMPREQDIRRVYRGDAPAADSIALADAVAALELPRGDQHGGIAYLTGEARTLQRVRRHLVDGLGWNRRSVRTKPFWTPGKRGLE